MFASFFVDIAPMNSMMDQTPRSLHVSPSILSLIAIALLTAAGVAGQTRVFPSSSTNANNARHNHIATIHSADSGEGSRVSISSDQSLNDYEAYRRGDRFYVRIPAADVPRAEAIRGRGFGDVTAQRSGNSTLLSFRLQPGATAHVEQHGNRLEVVISVPGGGSSSTSAASRSNDFRWSDPSGNTRSVSPLTASRSANSTPANTRNARSNQTAAGGNKNSSSRDNAGSATNANSKTKAGNSNSSAANRNDNANSAASRNGNTNSNSASLNGNANSSVGLNGAGSTNSANSSGPGPAQSPNAMSSSGANANSSGQSQSTGSFGSSASPSPGSDSGTTTRRDFWSRAKERGHYWLLLAQLNPIPVAIGVALLILIIALLLIQRRRAKSTRRVKTVTKSKSRPHDTAASKPVERPLPAAPVAATAVTQPTPASEDVTEATRAVATPPIAPVSENGRKERVNRATEETNKIFTGQAYDESIVGSDDRETRRMVGAELLSAMVGRNTERRERARAAFMKHGYFDDATRDLRTASSENERAAAARRLSFVQDPEATPHLVGALSDASPDVRRAAVEALMDQRDPAAIAPLNALLQNEKDRKVPRHLIEQAIEACATNPQPAPVAAPSSAPPTPVEDREVIEI